MRTSRLVAGGLLAFVTTVVGCDDPSGPTTGSIRVVLSTTGAELPNRYTVRVDGRPPASVDANGSLTIESVSAGIHTVRLDQLTANCAPVGSVGQTVTVVAGEEAVVPFSVRCVAMGTLRLTNATSGSDLDGDGYGVRILGVGPSSFTPAMVSLGTDRTVTSDRLLPGIYSITVTGVAENCDLVGPQPRQVEIPPGETVTVALDVVCAPATRLAFVSDRDGNAEIYAVNSNGTGLARLTSDLAQDIDPAWSPDGSRIAFASDRGGGGQFDIYVMNADGSNVARLTSAAGLDVRPAWSPDGRRIAFASGRDLNYEIYTMRADDGSDLVRLTNDPFQDTDPAWSPDGRQIVFSSDRRDGASIPELYLMNAGGSAVTLLLKAPTVSLPQRQPAWSPDGSRIAFVSDGDCDDYYYYYYYDCGLSIRVVRLIAADTSTQVAGAVSDARPTWSPDGRTIAFAVPVFVGNRTVPSINFLRLDGSPGGGVIVAGGHSPTWRR